MTGREIGDFLGRVLGYGFLNYLIFDSLWPPLVEHDAFSVIFGANVPSGYAVYTICCVCALANIELARRHCKRVHASGAPPSVEGT
jgi:hypothetical protein